tara:strand:- start:1877 stop:2017 length:141 start_codon:yes stop_codon:yes gene_type:complete
MEKKYGAFMQTINVNILLPNGIPSNFSNKSKTFILSLLLKNVIIVG